MNRAQVLFQGKKILTEQELIAQVRRVCAGDILPQPTSEVVKRALVYIHENFGAAVTRTDLAAASGVCESYFSTVFRKEMGLAPGEYLTRFRMLAAKDALESTDRSVTHIAALVGFEDPGYFCRVFRRYSGQSPQRYRQDARAGASSGTTAP